MHSTHPARILLISVSVCALAGCWDEIHYQPPPSGSEVTNRATRPPTDADASNFADDVAASLADEPAPPQIVDATPPPVETMPPDETASVAVSEANAFPKSRQAAWSLGSTLSLAAIANDRAVAEDRVAGWFETSRQQAEALGTVVADLPPRPTADQVDPEGRRAMEYLLAQGQVIGPHLAATFGDDHNALFEVALKSNLLLVRYQPQAPVAELLAAAISDASERADLPPEVVQPVLTLVEQGAPWMDVRNAVFDMHALVEQHVEQHFSPTTP